jgi:hypothetical protein
VALDFFGGHILGKGDDSRAPCERRTMVNHGSWLSARSALFVSLSLLGCSSNDDPPASAMDAGSETGSVDAGAETGAAASGEWRCREGSNKCDCEKDRETPSADFTLATCAETYPCCFTYEPGPNNPGKAAAPNERECGCRQIPDEAQCNQTLTTLEGASAGNLANFARAPKCPPP